MSFGQQAYQMRAAGLMWTEIGRILGCRPNVALYAAERYAVAQGLPRLVAKRRDRPARVARRHAVKGDAERWSKMHCGKGLRAADIAKAENVDVDLVRKTLKNHRQEKSDEKGR